MKMIYRVKVLPNTTRSKVKVAVVSADSEREAVELVTNFWNVGARVMSVECLSLGSVAWVAEEDPPTREVRIVTWHGEAGTVHYVVLVTTSDESKWEVLNSFPNDPEAARICKEFEQARLYAEGVR